MIRIGIGAETDLEPGIEMGCKEVELLLEK